MISGGVYRLIGPLYTTSSTSPSGTIVPFLQESNTFYLDTSVEDLASVSISSSLLPFTLPSVPSGVPVLATGRCVASEMVRIFTPTLTQAEATAFTSAPGFDNDKVTANTSFPFRAYTNSSAQIDAWGSGSGTMDCVTDG